MLTLLSAALAMQAAPQTLTAPDWFPFVLPWNSAPNGSALDVSFLNHRPAGSWGRVRREGSVFRYERAPASANRLVRFVGTNVGSKAAFPDKATADAVAARMAKLGINLVRFHHLNNGWDLDGGTIWKRGRTHIEIDAAQLDKLDYFVAALKKQGIYINMNLQTSREMVPELGFPESVRQVPSFQKKLDKVNRRMIELQKQYAKDLLDRVNPYTGLKYKDDPALMVVEINNENSLFGWPGETPGAGISNWPEPFRSEMKAKWNAWLLKKHGGDAGLARAWPARDERGGPEMLTAQSAWTFENLGTGSASWQSEGASTGSSRTAPAANFTVQNNPGPEWHIQAHLANLSWRQGQAYTLQFEVRSEPATNFSVDSRLQVDPWRFLGLNATVSATPTWRTVSLTFTANETVDRLARLSFVFGGSRGRVQIRNANLRAGTFTAGKAADESAERGTVEFPTPDGSPKFNDWKQFLAETERAYSEEMRAYLRQDLGLNQVNIIDSQISWGGTTGIWREQNSEFGDTHAYWMHPTFLGSDWDPKNWRVPNRSMLPEMRKGGGELLASALVRDVTKPFSVSEYNHCAPGDFQAEQMPLYASVAAFQGWDIIYTFAWDATGPGVRNDMYENFFDVARNPNKSAFFPAAALIFRTGLVAPSRNALVARTPQIPWSVGPHIGDLWARSSVRPDVLVHRIGQRLGSGAAPAFDQENASEPSSPFKIEGPEATPRMSIANPQMVSLLGWWAGHTAQAPGLTVQFAPGASPFRVVTVTPTDGRPITSSERILVTVADRWENQRMGWNAARDSVSDQWGEGPIMARFVPATFTFTRPGALRIWALNPDGTRKMELPQTRQAGSVRLSTSPSHGTVYYELAVR